MPGVVALPPGHRLAAAPLLTPKDLEGETFVSLGRQDETRDLVDSLFESQGVSRRLDYETNLATTACALVAGGAGVTLVDALSPSAFGNSVVVRPIHPTVRFRIEILTPLGKPPSNWRSGFVAFVTARMRAAVT